LLHGYAGHNGTNAVLHFPSLAAAAPYAAVPAARLLQTTLPPRWFLFHKHS